MSELYTVLGQLGIVIAFGAVGAALFRREFRLKWFLTALALYVLYDFLLTRGFYTLPRIPEDASWNWMGKSLAAFGMLVVASLPMFGTRRVGLTLSQRNGIRAPLAVTLLLASLFFYFAVSDDSGPADLETIFFQWTMPGIDEELFYRGVLLVAMNEAFKSRISLLGAPIGYGGLLTSLLFGLVHSLEYAGGFDFDPGSFAITALPSLILLWLRERTGSLLFPVAAHNVANGAFVII